MTLNEAIQQLTRIRDEIDDDAGEMEAPLLVMPDGSAVVGFDCEIVIFSASRTVRPMVVAKTTTPAPGAWVPGARTIGEGDYAVVDSAIRAVLGDPPLAVK